MELRSPPHQITRNTISKGFFIGSLVATVLVTALLSVYGTHFLSSKSSAHGDAPRRLREIASRLKAAGAVKQASKLYSEYLATSIDPPYKKAQVAFALGESLLEQGRYEKALRWFYEAEMTGAPTLREEVGKKVVHCLERLGRVHAAQAALSSRVDFGKQTSGNKERANANPDSDPVVAIIGSQKIRKGELLRALDDLPPHMRKNFTGEKGLVNFLRQYVSSEILWHKAQKLELDKDPKVRRQLHGLLKQVVVGQLMEQEIAAKLSISESDVKNFFEANKSLYQIPAHKGKDGTTEIPATTPEFTKIEARVRADYRAQKSQETAQQLIQEQLQAQQVQMFPQILTTK